MLKIPEKFTKYPWVTMVLIVILGLGVLYAAADIFGAEWLQGRIDKALDE